MERQWQSLRARLGSIRGGTQVILVTFFLLAGLGAWAAWAQIDELVRARGQVIASARTQVIQSADNGVLDKILVREGQTVRKGELLAMLDQSRARAAYDDSRNKVAALKAALVRLRAEVYETPLVFPSELAEWTNFQSNQRELFRRRQQAVHEGLSALRASRSLAARELAISEPLLASGDVGEAEVIRLQRVVSDLDGQIVTLRNRYFQDAQTEMTKAEEDLETQEELLRERQTILDYTELRAPLDGLVRKVVVTTPGASVRQGDSVIELLPTSGRMVVEAKYLPTDVSSVRVGAPATVKLDAYDASIYGSLEGRVIYVSPDALSDPHPSGEMIFYRVQVGLDPQKRGVRRIPVLAGMTATVEVRSRKRSVLSFLTKPITKTLSNSLGER